MSISKTVKVILPVIALVGLTSLMGCPKTAEGVGQDAGNNTRAAQEAASRASRSAATASHKAGEAASQAGKDVAGALAVTPMVKTAIAADKDLNDPKNKIDVDTADGKVHLKGHVISNALKKRAGDITMKTLMDQKRTDKVVNQLLVQAAK